MLERQYVISKVALGAVPGSPVSNLIGSVILDPVPNSPYALCAKCHDLKFLVQDTTWSQHSRHISKGFSCSVCHSGHGVPTGTSGVTGNGLVSFDLNVVAPNNAPITYNGGTSCTLTCHNQKHN
jgi:hypothetical protein